MRMYIKYGEDIRLIMSNSRLTLTSFGRVKSIGYGTLAFGGVDKMSLICNEIKLDI